MPFLGKWGKTPHGDLKNDPSVQKIILIGEQSDLPRRLPRTPKSLCGSNSPFLLHSKRTHRYLQLIKSYLNNIISSSRILEISFSEILQGLNCLLKLPGAPYTALQTFREEGPFLIDPSKSHGSLYRGSAWVIKSSLFPKSHCFISGSPSGKWDTFVQKWEGGNEHFYDPYNQISLSHHCLLFAYLITKPPRPPFLPQIH